jgi:hypothetical protein
MKPISEIIVKKHVQRMRRARDGERYLEEKTFSLKYNPSIQHPTPRIFAKTVDVLIFTAVGIAIYFTIGRNFDSDLEILCIGLILHFLVNPYFEAKRGKSIGKYLFKMQVINDYGGYPSLPISYKRNFLSLFSSIISLTVLPRQKFPIKSDYHNYICKTWVIPDSEKETALKLIHEN